MAVSVLYLLAPALLAVTVETTITNRGRGPIFYVIAGTPAELGQFPYQAVIFSDNRLWCGGSLVTTTRLLTAAHCVQKYKEYIVRLGGIYKRVEEKTAWTSRATVAKVHPEYNTLVYHNHDIAVVFLTEPAPLSNYINLVALPTTLEVNNSFVGEKALVSGHGKKSGSSLLSEVLLWSELTVVSNSECIKYHKPGYIVESTLCAMNEHYTGTCKGDSGSALVLKTDSGYKQIGVTSFGDSPGCDEHKPSAYVRVTSVLDWITKTISETV